MKGNLIGNDILVSVIMPCYNAERFVSAAINSVLSQTYENIELVIVNDGSTDNSEKIIQSFADKRIVYCKQENKGQDSALNYGFGASQGQLIKFMDADDVINKEMVELQMQALLQYPEKVAYGEWYRFFGAMPEVTDETRKMWYWKDMAPVDFLTVDQDGPMLQCGIMMMRRELILKAGLWDERLILYNDTEFFTRVLLASRGITFTAGAKLFYRSGTSSSLSVQQERKYFESTFLATNLIEQHLLQNENSIRIRRLLANIYFRRRYEMYPYFKDLAKRYEEAIAAHGKPNLFVKGGKLHNFISVILGWKAVVLIHRLKNKIKKKIFIKNHDNTANYHCL